MLLVCPRARNPRLHRVLDHRLVVGDSELHDQEPSDLQVRHLQELAEHDVSPDMKNLQSRVPKRPDPCSSTFHLRSFRG